MTHCDEFGHMWIEASGLPYARHRQRPEATVDVACQYCEATATLVANANNTAPPLVMPPAIDGDALQAVQSRIAFPNTGPVPKTP